MAKFVPVACELNVYENEDPEEFIKRRKRLEPLGHNDTCLERVLAVFDGDDGRESLSVASLLNKTALSLEQKIAQDKVIELCDVKTMLKELSTALALHGMDHGGISSLTIFVDDEGQVHLRGFMRTANLRRLTWTSSPVDIYLRPSIHPSMLKFTFPSPTPILMTSLGPAPLGIGQAGN